MVAMKGLMATVDPLLMGSFRLLPAGLVLVAVAAAQGRPQPSGTTAWMWVTAFALVDAAAFQVCVCVCVCVHAHAAHLCKLCLCGEVNKLSLPDLDGVDPVGSVLPS
jgi:hypothetical protein